MSELRPAGLSSPFDHRRGQWNYVQLSDNPLGCVGYSQQHTPAGTISITSHRTPLSNSVGTHLDSTGRTRSERQDTPQRVFSPSSQVSSTNKRKQGRQPNTTSAKRRGTPASVGRSTSRKSTSKRSRRQGSPSPRASPGHGHPHNYLDKPPPHLFNTKRQHRPEICQFVKLAAKPEFWHLAPNFLNEHAEFACCTKCSVKIPFKTSNHQVVPHMERFHPNDLGTSRPIERNLNAEFADTVGNIREITKEEQEQVNRWLARWISAHFRPFLLVEDKGFIEFVTYITKTLGCGNVPLSKRTQLRRCIIIFANEVREYVQVVATSHLPFIMLMKTSIQENWTLEVKEIPSKHTGKLIAEYLDIIMNDWKLDKGKSTRLVRDSGRNMVSAGKILGVEHFSCLAHDIHLVVAGALSKDKNTILTEEAAQWASFEYEVEESVYEEDTNLSTAEREEVEKLRKRASKEMDKYLNETLTNLQKGERNPFETSCKSFGLCRYTFVNLLKATTGLRGFKPRIWISPYKTPSRCIKLEKALNVFFEYLGTVRGQNEFTDVHSKLTIPSHKDILTVKCLCTLLRPFTEVSKQLSGHMYPTLPVVLPSLCGLEKTLRIQWIFDKIIHLFRKESYANETRVEMQRCRETLLSLITNRFDDRMISEPKWVAFLDPRIAGQMPHLRDDECQEAMDDLVAATAELAGDHLPVFPGETQTSDDDDDDDDFINQLLCGRKRRVSSNYNTTPIVAKCRREFKRYLAEVAIDSDESDESEPIKNPFDWWKGNQHKYRNLSRVARKWLGTIATSIASERAFSTSGNMLPQSVVHLHQTW